MNAVQQRKTQALLNTSELKQQLWQGVVEISSLLVGSGFFTHDEIQKFVISLKEFANHSQAEVGYLECTQIAAKLQDSESSILKCRL